MAYNGILCTEAEIVLYAGANVGAGSTEANHNLLVAQAEAFVTGLARYDWVTNVATLTAVYKQVLAEFCSRFAAVALIANDMSGYTSRIEAEDMLNIHLFRMKILQALISDQKWVTYAKGD